MTPDASSTISKANVLPRFLYKFAVFPLGFIMLLVFGYLLMVGSGVGLAFGLYALLIYFICFVGGIYLTSFIVPNSKYLHKIIGVGAIFFILIFIVLGQQFKWFDGLGNELTVQGLGFFLSSYLLGFNGAFVIKNLMARLRPLRSQNTTIDHRTLANSFNLRGSLMMGFVNGILLGMAWIPISVPLGINLGIGLGLAISAFHHLATHYEINGLDLDRQ